MKMSCYVWQLRFDFPGHTPPAAAGAAPPAENAKPKKKERTPMVGEAKLHVGPPPVPLATIPEEA